MRYLVLVLLVWMVGCAGVYSERHLVIDGVGGDLWIKRIGSDSQMQGGERGVEVDVVGQYGGRVVDSGVLGLSSVEVRNVSGSFYIEEALTGMVNVEMGGVVGKLFKPGDPFRMDE